MSARTMRTTRSLLALLVAAPWFTVWAQSAPTPPAANGSNGTNGTNGAKASNGAQAPVYVDRVIEGLPPEPMEAAESQPYDRSGWPRFLRLETRLGTQPFDANRDVRIGYGIYGLLETPNHGTLSIDGTYAPRGSSGSLTLRQRAMPLSSGWLMSNELGVITPPSPAILRLPARIYLPSAILQGVSTEWENPGKGLQLQASTGEPGRLEFLPSNGFRKLSGQRTSFGGQWRINADDTSPLSNRGWTVALQHEDARRVSNFDLPMQASDIVNANATVMALRHEGAEHRVQAQVLRSQASDVIGSRTGFWVDGEWDDGPRTHGLGAYRLEQGLSWANLPLANDLVGAYARSSWRTRQWSAEGSVDWLDSISGRSGSGFFATGSARWRLNRDHTVGAGATVRRFAGDAWSSYGDWRFLNGWGSSGLRLEVQHGDNEPDATWLTWDQEWLVPQGWSLSTTLGAGAYGAQQSRPRESVWRAALSMTAPITSKASLRGNVNTEHSNTGQSRHSLNLGGNWRIDQRWSVEASYNRYTGRSRFSPSLDPLAPPVDFFIPQSDRSFYAVLRYELEAGSRNVPLGGRASDGGGRIEGTVYFDDNRSGTQEASERGVPNVTVYLDNRYAVRTDSQGRFEFPFVANGPRTVTVRGETLPLPWNVVNQGQARVDVRLRESASLSIPVQRAE